LTWASEATGNTARASEATGNTARASEATGKNKLASAQNVAVAGEARTPAPNKGEVFTSFDVNAFEVPSGRDEAWRFTPMRRLRGLHDGTATADGSVVVDVENVEGVTVETVGRDDARLGQAGAPADRVAAQAYSSFDNATVLSVGNEVEVAAPVHVTITGPG